MQGAPQGQQRLPVLAEADVAQAAKNVLQHSQGRKDGHSVDQVKAHRDDDADKAKLDVVAGQDAQSDRQGVAQGAELDLGSPSAPEKVRM